MKLNLKIPAAVVLLLCPALIIAQDSVINEDSGADTVKGKASIHSLYAGAGYGSNMVYMGSTISQDKPYGYASLTYGLGEKLYLSGSAVHLANTSPFAAFFTGTLSFSHTFNSWFDISAGISRYQVDKSLTNTLFESFTYGDITLGVDWKLLYTRFSAGRIFSSENGNYYQIRNSRYFQTPEFSKKKLWFSFEPYINLIFGTYIKTETTSGTSTVFSPPFRKHGANNQSQGGTTIYSSIFGMLEADFGMPVAFNSSRITIEAEPGYIYPLYEEAVYPGTKGFLMMISLYFRIF